MGLTFDNPNNLQKMLDRFATVPDPKKTPKHKDPEELLNKDSKDKKKKKESGIFPKKYNYSSARRR